MSQLKPMHTVVEGKFSLKSVHSCSSVLFHGNFGPEKAATEDSGVGSLANYLTLLDKQAMWWL